MGCGTCGSSESDMPIRYRCDCGDDCACLEIGFKEEPKAEPYCCGAPMKKIE